MNPKVSICIPAYKQIVYLRMVLDSILIQTYENYELIITDDSPDNAVEELIKGYNFNGKLKYSRNVTQLGSPANWNYAISLAQGKYIKILHNDDFFNSSHSLAKFVEIMDNNPFTDFGFSASEVWSLSSNNKKLFSCTSQDLKRIEEEPEFLFFRNVIGGPSATIFRKDAKIEYDTKFKWLVDVDFYIRILNHNKNVAYYGDPLVCTVDGAEGQITQSLIENKQIQIKEFVLLYRKLQKLNTKISVRKFSFYFKLLFYKYQVMSLAELKELIDISVSEEVFYVKIISAVNRNILITRMLLKFYNSRFNKKYIKMKLY